MTFETERDLCDKFREEWFVHEEGTVVYNETAGWDMLVVRANGEQAGVQAKLRANLDVLYQAVHGLSQPKAPNIAVVLVPHASKEFIAIAHKLKICVCHYDDGFKMFRPKHYAHSSARCDLPPMVPEVPAGVPSPRKLTAWTLRELRLLWILRNSGRDFLRTKDFKSVGLDPQRVMPSWLYRADYNRFELVLSADTPDVHHPKAWESVKEEMESASTKERERRLGSMR
jgi:hypothetical protein